MTHDVPGLPELPGLPEQERYWETWQATKSITEWSQIRAEAILKLFRGLDLRQPKILDLGCGNGWFTERLAAYGDATGVDLSLKAMDEAKRQFPRATFLGGDLFEVELPSSHYDVVVSQQVIAHVVDQARYVERAASLLKSRGHLLLTTPNRFVMDRLGDVGWETTPPEHLEFWLDKKALLRLLRPRFEILHFTSILPIGQQGLLRLVNSEKLNGALRRVIPEARLRTWKERAGFGYTLIVLARKRD
jgi:2-polyprenyl-3-methyl-5-hydroxy-6-metoxy-1,4-benzoquinol methylase